MSRYLGDFGYGNRDISGPIDQFWLDGELRISPRGQVEFLHRMLAGELPVNRSNVELVWRLLEIESGPGFTWRGKTGLGVMYLYSAEQKSLLFRYLYNKIFRYLDRNSDFSYSLSFIGIRQFGKTWNIENHVDKNIS